MPPEPLPWDRKDYGFKEHRKHDRGSSHERGASLGSAGDSYGGGGGSMNPRWRDPYHYPQRDFRGPSPRRPPPGHYRQGGGYHSVYSPDSSGGYGCTPSRSDKFWSEDDSFRPSSSSRYGNSGRSSSGGFGNRDGHGSVRRSPYRDASEFSRSQHRGGGGYHVSSSASRSVAAPFSPASQPPLKDKDDKNSGGGGGGGDDNCLSTGNKLDQRDSPLCSISSWKSKWSRQSTVTSTTKTGENENKEAVLEVQIPTEKETPSRSLVTSPLPSEDGAPKKKPRLGWGQGLAKYEKQKVEGSLDASSSGAKGSVCEMSPRIVGLPGSLSPATPCSAACTSHGGEVFMPFKATAEDKVSVKTLDGDHATCHNCETTETNTFNCCEEVPIKLDELEVSSNAKLMSLLADLLQPEDACSGDSVQTRHSAMSKLLAIKEHISKELEKTECEIDLLETEFRSLDSEIENIPSQSLSKLKVYSALHMDVHTPVITSNDLALPCDNSKAVTVSDKLQSSNFVELATEVKNTDDASINKMLPSSSPIKCLANEPESDKDVGLCSAIDIPVGFKVTGSELLALYDTRNMGSSSKVSAAEEDSSGSNASSVAGTDGEGPNFVKLIVSTNQGISKQALKDLGMHSPIDLPKSNILESHELSACRKNYTRVKKIIAKKKRWLNFKEKALSLKYRAFNHLWKEDLRLLMLRRQRQKSSNRVDVNSLSLLHGSQKQRSALRSRFASPAGNVGLVPTTAIIDFTSRILSDAQIKPYRHNLKMPALILDDKERRCSRFITNNGLVEDPVSYENEKEMINPWSQKEKEVFLEMLATFGKDFSKISSFLNHKTTADCIKFYYQNHKSESFNEVKKKLDLRKQQCALPANTFMVTSQKKWNIEANAASLDILGAASVIAAHNHGTSKSQKQSGKTIPKAYSDWKVPYSSYDYPVTANGRDFSDNDRETVAADVLAGICGSISSEAMSSCITGSADRGEKKKVMSVDQSLTAEVTQSLDDDICSDEDFGEMNSSAWTDEEKSLLIRALSLYGKDFDAIAACVRTRTREQCKIFFSKARKCLGLDNIHQDNVIVEVPLNESNGGRSDTDDACAGEMDSAIGSTQSCSKLEADLSPFMSNNNEESAVRESTTPIVENDNSSVQRVGDFIVKDDQKVDMEVQSLEDDNLICQGSNSPLVMPLKESKDFAVTSNENLLCAEVADSAHTKTEEVGSSVVKPVEPVTTSSLEADSMPIVAATSLQLEGTCDDSQIVELKKNVDAVVLPVTDNGLVNRQQAKIGFSGNTGSSFCFAYESGTNGSAHVQGNKVGGLHARIGLLPYQRLPQLDPRSSLLSTQQSFLSMQENGHSLHLTSFLQDSSISFGGQVGVASKSTLNFEEHGNKQHQNVPSRDLYQFKSNSSLNQVDRQFQILRGYPLQILNQHETKEGDPVTERTVLAGNYSRENGFPQSNGFFSSASPGNKGNSVSLSDSVASTICSSRSENQSDFQTRSSAKRTSDAEEHRTGDVKLFGQILTHPSVQKSSSSVHGNKTKTPSTKVSRALLSPGTGKDDLFACRSGDGSRIVRDELPVSFGFWDGNRIQTGLSALPEPSVMMAKYPSPITGLSFYSPKDGLSSNGLLADYPPSYMQNLASDGKRVENFTELPMTNGRDIFSGFQQQRRMTTHLGTNIIGNEILVGNEEVSDPVKALKLHYAGRTKVEVDSWRTNIR